MSGKTIVRAASFKEAEKKFGPIHAVVNNAGVTATRPALDQDERAWDSVVDTNLKGVWLVAQAAARRMIENKVTGSIVNIASILGVRVAGAAAPYAISKAGVSATDRFVSVAKHVAANDHLGARTIWEPLQRFIPKLFQEANPMPIKHCLWRQGLIASPECRLPQTSVSVELGGVLDRMLGDSCLVRLWQILLQKSAYRRRGTAGAYFEPIRYAACARL